jgi:transcriptional regulator with AAA-type ATPase domain
MDLDSSPSLCRASSTPPHSTDVHTFMGTPAIISSQAMRRLVALVERVARANAAILITGESGTGKELIARAIHHYSMRSARPWIDLNCAALPELLIESELFGYEKGAFSGALTTKPGMFELAQTGSVFLDEIGDLPPRMQVKLLRVLDGAPYYRLGGTRKISVDARVIAATNQDLEEAMAGGISAAICITAWRRYASTCRPCASVRTMCARWRDSFWKSRNRACGSAMGRSMPWSDTCGRATCGSCATWWCRQPS